MRPLFIEVQFLLLFIRQWLVDDRPLNIREIDVEDHRIRPLPSILISLAANVSTSAPPTQKEKATINHRVFC
jgi:hypothetical protein